MCFSSLDINFYVTSGFRESKALSVGHISDTFEPKNAYLQVSNEYSDSVIDYTCAKIHIQNEFQ